MNSLTALLRKSEAFSSKKLYQAHSGRTRVRPPHTHPAGRDQGAAGLHTSPPRAGLCPRQAQRSPSPSPAGVPSSPSSPRLQTRAPAAAAAHALPRALVTAPRAKQPPASSDPSGALASRPAHRPRPRSAPSRPPGWSQGFASARLPGVWPADSATPSPGRPPPHPGKGDPRGAWRRRRRAGRAHREGWAGGPSGRRPREEAPALPAGAGRSRVPAQGDRACPRAGRRHTCPGVTSARAPGACVSGRSTSCGPGLRAPLARRQPRAARNAGARA